MTPLEKMARAILKRRWFDWEPEAYASLDAFYAEIDHDHVQDARDEARAAVQAIRDPDEEMIEAGVRDGHAKTLGGIAENCHRAMIDNILERG